MQTKDIPDKPIIDFIIKNGIQNRYTWFPDVKGSLAEAMPEGTPKKLVLSKIRSMVKRGVLVGCPCGCRGDFYLSL